MGTGGSFPDLKWPGFATLQTHPIRPELRTWTRMSIPPPALNPTCMYCFQAWGQFGLNFCLIQNKGVIRIYYVYSCNWKFFPEKFYNYWCNVLCSLQSLKLSSESIRWYCLLSEPYLSSYFSIATKIWRFIQKTYKNSEIFELVYFVSFSNTKEIQNIRERILNWHRPIFETHKRD